MQMERLDELVHERTSELRRSEEQFSAAFRASPVALVIQTLEDDRFIDANEAFSALVGGGSLGRLSDAPRSSWAWLSITRTAAIALRDTALQRSQPRAATCAKFSFPPRESMSVANRIC
jgi:PAS domain-containing protein